MAVNSLYLLIWMVTLTSRMDAQPLTDHQKLSLSNQSFIEKCVSVHNYYRSRVNPPASNMMYMTWDETLAKIAQAWASKCTFDHNPSLKKPYALHPSFREVGENVQKQIPSSSFSVERAVQQWVDELQNYSYATNQCTGVCGHYTQVVWARSYKVGCAVQSCSGGQYAIFVCNYGEVGNVVGQHPYQQGTPCTACPGKNCWQNLCY